ncbi:recombinase RecT [Flaviaesturariibacter amylovorans]|uniref:Recombinase RecT n=1 Tax=Flaviaesturariibacter amylovorans TaxID=1084520 RepID=A0ABP8GQU3_9BACT
MSTELTTTQPQGVKGLFSREDVKAKFAEMLGKRAPAFITSVLQIVAQNDLLRNCDPTSIYQAAAVAATLDLPLNNNLGFAYIVPYKQKKNGQYVDVAQFQMGYKGFIQLAQRSGQFRTIAATPIYEGQIVEQNPLTGFRFDFTKKGTKIVGYAASFQLLNGFEKTLYATVEELNAHGKKYSQTFKKGFGMWQDNFDAMATKTVLKALLSKFAPLSIEMQTAALADQSIIRDAETLDVEYIDNTTPTSEEASAEKERQRIAEFIGAATTLAQLEDIDPSTLDEDLKATYNQKVLDLKAT